MNYVTSIEPRLTSHRPAAPVTTGDVLVEWTHDLREEVAARLRLVDEEDLVWQPHPDANNVAVTVWHVARWLDVLGTRIFTGRGVEDEVWHAEGWRALTGYEPEGVGYLGLGTLTGYTPEEMRAVPVLTGDQLDAYLEQAAGSLVDQVRALEGRLVEVLPGIELSPYQLIGSTLQGSFGHVGEIDTLVALRHRLPG